MSADDLFAAALAVRERAYAPYSQYLVGAALRDEQGRIHVGANVENAAYPQSQCAEASAIGVMIAAGGRKITEVLVIADGTLGIPTPVRRLPPAAPRVHGPRRPGPPRRPGRGPSHR